MTSGTESRDGQDPRYREWLLPPWWLWLVAVAFAASLAVAYGYALGAALGAAVAVAGGAVAVALLLATSPRLRVDELGFRAGRARLPLRYVGRVAALDAETSREARTVELDPSAHTLLRTWSAPRLVIVEVTDERDPHPYWLVSTRRPEALVRELVRSAADAGGGPAVRAGA